MRGLFGVIDVAFAGSWCLSSLIYSTDVPSKAFIRGAKFLGFESPVFGEYKVAWKLLAREL